MTVSPFTRQAEALLTRGMVRRALRPHAVELLASALWSAASAAHYRSRGLHVPDLPDGATLAMAAARQAREDSARGYRVLPQR